MDRRAGYWLLWVYVCTVPWQNTLVIPGLGTVAKGAGGMAAVVLAITILARGRLKRPHPFLALGASFVAYSALSALWSVNATATLTRTSTYLALLVAAWAVWELVDAPSKMQGLLQAYVLGACVSVLGVFSSFATGQTPYDSRYVAVGFDPNDLGVTLALGLPMAAYLLVRGSKRKIVRFVNVAYMLAVVPSAFLTASRTAAIVIGLALAASAWMLARTTHLQKATLLTAVGIGAMVLLIVGLVPSTALERLATLPEEVTEGTLNGRLLIWSAGWRVWRDHPIIGVGANGFRHAVTSLLGSERVAHNTFLGVLVDGGILGFLLFTLAMFSPVWGITRMGRPERLFWVTVLGGLLVGSMALSWEHHKVTWLIISLLASQRPSHRRQVGAGL